jgi:Tfp pilus assembly protein PilN
MNIINLLPKKQKVDLKTEQRFRLAIFALSWLSFTILILCLLLYSSNLYLKIQQKSLDDNLASQKNNPRWTEIVSSETKLKDLNTKIKTILDLQSKTKFWSPFLAEIANNIVTGVSLKNITLNTTGKIATISGHAETRENALDFQSALEKNSFVNEVKAPLENFLDQTNIDFSFTLLLK